MRFLKKSPRHKTLFAVIVLLAGSLCLFGCNPGVQQNVTPDPSQPQPQISISAADRKTTYDGAAVIRLDQLQDSFCITEPGSYVLTGELKGNIRIDAQDQVVHIALSNVTVDSESGPALEIISAGKVILSLLPNTTNTFLDSGHYFADTEADACIFSACDLTINGSGTLNVHGYYKDAIHTKDVLKLLGGTYFIQSKRDGLHGNDGIVLAEASATIQSERNGLHSTKTGKPGKGNIEIFDSVCSVIGGHYAVSCMQDLYVADSKLHAMGVYDNLYVAGQSFVAEGSIENE